MVHNYCNLIVLLPVLELSVAERSTLKRFYQLQLAMILNQERGKKPDGCPEGDVTVRKFEDYFPVSNSAFSSTMAYGTRKHARKG